MEFFQPGTRIPTQKGIPATVVKYLAGGGQGDVYVVDFAGEKKALKWYKPNAVKNPKKFYENLERNARKGSPAPAFLWPITATEEYEGSFGYVMDLRPDGYYELCDFMLAKVKFSTFKAATEACIQIVNAFRILHNSGYCYQDMNDGNFFIDPKTGEVLICDNDNASPNGLDTFIIGTPRYMAPEVVLAKAKPNTQTDRFSLSVVLFMILCMNHPLEGKRWTVPCLTPELERALYGSDPVFLYDPNNKENRPVKGIHNNVMKRWDYMPPYIKEAFLKAFSKEAMENPAKRLRELDWMKVLVRFQNDIVRCPHCQNEVFIINAANTACDGCGRPMKIQHTLKLPDYNMTAARGGRVYRCQLGLCDANEALNRIGTIVAKNDEPDVLGFLNATDTTLIAITPSGKMKQVPPGQVVPLNAGIKIQTPDGKSLEIQ